MKFEILTRLPIAKASALLLLGLSLGSSQTTAPPYRIHCGGESLFDSQGNFWEADGHYTGGQTFGTDSTVTSTDTPALYKTERWNDASLSYSFNVPAGDYTVRLHFAEIYDADFVAGTRVFDVAINGTTVAQGLDVFAEAGADVALIKEYTATAADGKIEIAFTNVVGNAKVSAIEVLGAPAPHATTAPYRINAGSNSDFTDADGNLWESDSHYTNGSTFWSNTPVSGTTMSQIYQSERWNNLDIAPLVYSFPVDEGTYLVRLHFAEIFFTNVNDRIFNVNVNGDMAVENLDLINEAGPNVAVIKEYSATPKDGAITIDFTNSIQNAKISAIEILPASAAGARLPGKVQAISQPSIKGGASALSVFLPYAGAYSLDLRDMRGGMIARKTGHGVGEQRFTGLRPGVYFLDIKTGKTALTKKICLLP